MKTLGTPAPLMFVLALLVGSTAAQEKSPKRNPWYGFDVGSWVILHDKSTISEKVDERKRKRIILRYEKDAPVLGNIPEIDGKYGEHTSTSQHILGGFPDGKDALNTRNAIFKVGDKKLTCTITEYVTKRDRFNAKLAVWRSAEVKIPYREIPRAIGAFFDLALEGDVVRAEYTVSNEDATGKYTAEVIDLSSQLKIGTSMVSCVLEKLSFEETTEGKSVAGIGKRWLSEEIPGRIAKQSAKGTFSKAPFESETNVVDFKSIKRPG